MLETCVPEVELTSGGLTCVCCHCGRERTRANEWRERYPVTGERLTHGICSDCLFELYPDLAPQLALGHALSLT